MESSEPLSALPAALDPESIAVESLVVQAREGDIDAFAHLVRAFHPRVFRWALAFSADADEADDVAQEAMVIALRRLKQYRGGGSFTVWLYQITRRTAEHSRRKRTRRARLAAGPKAPYPNPRWQAEHFSVTPARYGIRAVTVRAPQATIDRVPELLASFEKDPGAACRQ